MMKRPDEIECYDKLYGVFRCWDVPHYRERYWIAWIFYKNVERPIFDEVCRILEEKDILPKEQ